MFWEERFGSSMLNVSSNDESIPEINSNLFSRNNSNIIKAWSVVGSINLFFAAVSAPMLPLVITEIFLGGFFVSVVGGIVSSVCIRNHELEESCARDSVIDCPPEYSEDVPVGHRSFRNEIRSHDLPPPVFSSIFIGDVLNQTPVQLPAPVYQKHVPLGHKTIMQVINNNDILQSLDNKSTVINII